MAVPLITIGSFGLETVVTASGEIFPRRIGGNAVYAAVGARLWSSSVGIIGKLPSNFPAEWLQALAGAGLDIRGVAGTACAVDREEWFIYRPDGSRADQLYARYDQVLGSRNREAKLAPDEIQALLHTLADQPAATGVSLREFRLRHPPAPEQVPPEFWPVRGCHLAPLPYEIHLEFARVMRARGTRITLDPGMYVSRLSPAALAALLAHVDVFLPSERELQALYPGSDAAQAVQALVEIAPVHVVAKLGGAGCLVWHAHKQVMVRLPAYPSRVVHLNGAGDAFCGGFLAGFDETGDPVTAARYGTVSASFVVEARDALAVLGVRSQATRDRLRLVT